MCWTPPQANKHK